MNDFRCGNCKRLLAKIDGKSRVEIVCPKCKTMNAISEIMDMSYDKIIEPFNKTMATFETSKLPKKFITYDEFDEAFSKVLPKLKEDWDKFMNEESPLAKLFDK